MSNSEESNQESDFCEEENDFQPKGNYTCGLCQKSFVTKAVLRTHMTKHDDSIKQSVKKLSRIRRSPNKKKNNSKVKSFCDVCKEEFNSNEKLQNHLNTHFDNFLRFECELCYLPFKTKSGLRQHVRRHTEEPQFLCALCGKKYYTFSKLNAHKSYCLNERKFACSICGKKFNLQTQLSRHMIIHESDRHIQCSECEKTFSRKDNYRQHFRCHSGEKPYNCECGSSFKSRSHYNYHKKRHCKNNLSVSEMLKLGREKPDISD